jgi:hypothetical protein
VLEVDQQDARRRTFKHYRSKIKNVINCEACTPADNLSTTSSKAKSKASQRHRDEVSAEFTNATDQIEAVFAPKVQHFKH